MTPDRMHEATWGACGVPVDLLQRPYRPGLAALLAWITGSRERYPHRFALASTVVFTDRAVRWAWRKRTSHGQHHLVLRERPLIFTNPEHFLNARWLSTLDDGDDPVWVDDPLTWDTVAPVMALGPARIWMEAQARLVAAHLGYRDTSLAWAVRSRAEVLARERWHGAVYGYDADAPLEGAVQRASDAMTALHHAGVGILAIEHRGEGVRVVLGCPPLGEFADRVRPSP